MNAPQVIRQRVVKMPSKSTYRIAFVLENDCSKVNVSLKALGDDGRKETVKVLNYKIGNKKFTANAEQLSLKNIKANSLNEVFVTLEHHEKMALELLIY